MNNNISKADNFNVSYFDEDLNNKVKSIFTDGTASNTIQAYKSDMNYIINWAFYSGVNSDLPLGKDVVIRFIVEHVEGLPEEVDLKLVENGIKQNLGPHSISTIQRRVAAISTYHKLYGHENPCEHTDVKTILKKAKRAQVRRGWKPNKKMATTADIIESLIQTCSQNDFIDIRDKAMILFAFSSGGRRRSEVVMASFSDIIKIPEGYLYTLPYSKTDQYGNDRLQVPIMGKAAIALEEWFSLIENKKGYIFRAFTPSGKITNEGVTDKTFNRIIKKRIKMAGYDEKDYSAHSIRSGFMTEGGRKNINILQLMELSGHKSVQIAKGYYRGGNILNNPASNLLD